MNGGILWMKFKYTRFISQINCQLLSPMRIHIRFSSIVDSLSLLPPPISEPDIPRSLILLLLSFFMGIWMMINHCNGKWIPARFWWIIRYSIECLKAEIIMNGEPTMTKRWLLGRPGSEWVKHEESNQLQVVGMHSSHSHDISLGNPSEEFRAEIP